MEEVWKSIEGFEGLYEISNYGRVKSLERKVDKYHQLKEKILKQNTNSKGYNSVTLCKNGSTRRFEIHRLVGKAFISIDCECFNHKDGNKSDNSIWNIEESTFSENINHAVDVLFSHGRALKVKIIDSEGKETIFGSMAKAEKFLNKERYWMKSVRKILGNKFTSGDNIIEILGR
ncbi:NUMOD4 domain-containing protein [Rossellomorea marisflavi]|uniref:NUMOD4 domain-containing protein n=1 Tax=Rossellomorea marisflavi TaxID=189381 RepID=UPI0025B20D18|nr:NUMOD4 domain-containing protein [Rossellomorea marisflavi]WJV20811.1 NUMOD4 domain-containing protein [Rossellomorea marisflavi]